MNKYLSLILFFSSYVSFAIQPSIQELELEQLFVIQNGFDSNDDVEVTLQIKLPNACYKVHEASINKITQNSYQVKAFAKKKDLSGCETGFYNTPVHVIQTLSLGELPAGEYQFSYTGDEIEKIKTMSIKPAHEQTIDDTLYAPVSNAFIPELIYPTQNAQVILTGIFNNSCFSLSQENIKIIRENNIFIIIPETQFLNRTNCKKEQSPIRQIVNLGPIEKAGSYLIHVRSMSGLAVNKNFFVSPEPLFNRGNLEP